MKNMINKQTQTTGNKENDLINAKCSGDEDDGDDS